MTLIPLSLPRNPKKWMPNPKRLNYYGFETSRAFFTLVLGNILVFELPLWNHRAILAIPMRAIKKCKHAKKTTLINDAH